MSLSISPFLSFLRRLFTGDRKNSPSTTNVGTGQAGAAGRDAYVAGGDITLATPDPLKDIPWHRKPGAPRVEPRPGLDRDRLLCDFSIFDSVPPPGDVEARWTGAGTTGEWQTPMRSNVRPGETRLAFQMKPTEMKPTPPTDEVNFEVRFVWLDGQHGYRWRWPLHQHETKGHWILDSHLGSGVNQPEDHS